jgi:hypothetical protein
VGLLAALLLVASALASIPAPARAACEQNWSSWTHPDKDVNGGWAPGVGYRAYSVGVGSYLRRCGGKTFAHHAIYFDTRAFPWGYKFMFSISTRRSDGVWRRVTKDGAGIFSFEGRQKVQEIILRQARFTPRGMRLTRVEVRHCACSLGSGAIPAASTLRGIYRSFRGPSAHPGPG